MSAHHELIDLVRDLRATIEDLQARGVATDPVSAAAIPVEVLEPIAEAPRAPSTWVALAEASRRQTREAVEAGAEGLRRTREDIGDCRRCNLCKERRNIVFGVGDPEADLMVVGEGPGHDEDLSGEPFVGQAGQMLDKMLENVLKLPRSRVYIANIVKCRPPGNRSPVREEVSACRPFLERQIRAVQPKVLLVLGPVALKALINSEAGFMSVRGSWLAYEGIPVMPTFHPDYLLQNANEKRKTFADLKAVNERYDLVGGKR